MFSVIFAMKCLSKPSAFFRRGGRPLLPTSTCPSPLVPQQSKAKLTLVNDIIRRSLSKSENRDESEKEPYDGTAAGGECATADSLFDISRENEWYLLYIQEGLPCARSKHAAVASEGNMYVVGGTSGDGHLGDVQVFNMDKFSWKELSPAAPEDVDSRPRELGGSFRRSSGPPLAQAPRVLAPFAAVWKGKLIVVGCLASAPRDSLVTVHAFDLSQRTWSALKADGEFPEARVGYRMEQVKSKLVMFGGEDANGRIVDDVFILDMEMVTWVRLQTTGEKPPPRRYHAMVCYGGRYIWIYGGKSYATYYNDVYCLDLKQLIWTKVKASGAIPTKPRAGHIGIMREETFYTIGGENRGDEMRDTLAFDIGKRTWSVVTSVHSMSPLAHDGLSVLKVDHGGRQYLVAFGGHGILLSCQMFALLLPSGDQGTGRYSLSSGESFRLRSMSRRSTIPDDKTSPTDPFNFHHAASLSSSSGDVESPSLSGDSGREFRAVERSKSSPRKQRPPARAKAVSGPLSSDASLPWDRTEHGTAPTKTVKKALSEELHQTSRLGNVSQLERSSSSQNRTRNCEEDSTTIAENNRNERLDNKLSVAGGWGLKVLESKDLSGRQSQPQTDANEGEKWWQSNDSRPHTPGKTNRAEPVVKDKQLRAVVKAIKDLQESQRSSIAKDDDLTLALQTIKELQTEVHELKRNKEDLDRRMQKRMMDMNTVVDKQSKRDNNTQDVAIAHKNEVERDYSATDSGQEKVTRNKQPSPRPHRLVQEIEETQDFEEIEAY